MFRRVIFLSMFFLVYSAVGYWPFGLSVGSADSRQAFNTSFEVAEKAFSLGNHAAAVSSYQAALTSQPDNLRVLFRLGQALMASGRNSEAYSRFQAILQKNPNSAPARFELAKCLIKLGETLEAKQHLAWVLKVQPTNEPARTLFESCADEIAQAPLGRRKPANPAGPGAESTDSGQPIPAETGEDGFLPLTSKASSISAKTGEGEIWIAGSSGSPGQTRIIALPNVSVQGWRVSDFLSLASDSLGITVEYIKYTLEKGDLQKAARLAERADQMASSGGESKRRLEILIQKTLITLYQADLRQFGQLLMRIKPMLSQKTFNSFLEIYNKAQSTPSPLDVARIVGGVAMGAEHYVVAARILSEVLASAPNDRFALRLLAQAQLENRDYSAAEASFQKLLSIAPQDSEAAFNLARFYLTAKFDPQKSREYARKSLQLFPGDERAQVLLAIGDYLESESKEVSVSLQKLVQRLKDQNLVQMVKRILENCRAPNADRIGLKLKLAQELSMPGSNPSSPESMTRLGEDLLKRGSYFSALKSFLDARNLPDIGRVYLALASNLAAAGDEKGSALAAGFGLNALKEELKLNPGSPQAHLYLGLYYFDRNDRQTSLNHVEAGLLLPASPDVKKHLLALKEQLG